jgi:ribosomal protein S27AE
MGKKMKCPRCGADMNHHADKMLPSESTEADLDTVFGAGVVEIHSCPACGAAASRLCS